MNHTALRNRIDELADDIGRLRRRVEPESSIRFLADRLACHVETISGILEPTAGELVACTAPGDEDAVVEAILFVDERHIRFRRRLAS